MIQWMHEKIDSKLVQVEITEEEAIRRQRIAGLTNNYVYPNDETALADFMEIHYAKKIEGNLYCCSHRD